MEAFAVLGVPHVRRTLDVAPPRRVEPVDDGAVEADALCELSDFRLEGAASVGSVQFRALRLRRLPARLRQPRLDGDVVDDLALAHPSTLPSPGLDEVSARLRDFWPEGELFSLLLLRPEPGHLLGLFRLEPRLALVKVSGHVHAAHSGSEGELRALCPFPLSRLLSPGLLELLLLLRFLLLEALVERESRARRHRDSPRLRLSGKLCFDVVKVKSSWEGALRGTQAAGELLWTAQHTCKNNNSKYPLQTSSCSSDWDSADWENCRPRAPATAEMLQERQKQLYSAELRRQLFEFAPLTERLLRRAPLFAADLQRYSTNQKFLGAFLEERSFSLS